MHRRRGRSNTIVIVIIVVLVLGALCCGGVGAGGWYGYDLWVQTRPGYQQGLALVQADPTVVDRIGSPIVDKGEASWGSDAERPGAWLLTIPISGSKGDGTLVVVASDTGPEPVLHSATFIDPVYEDELDLLALSDAATAELDAEARAEALAEGQAALRRGDLTAAMQAFDQVIAGDPDDTNARLARGRLHAEEDRHSEAIADLEVATTDEVLAGEAWRLMGAVHAESRDYDSCISAYTEALRYRPDDGEAWWGRAKCYRGMDDMRSFRAGAREACTYSITEACPAASTR